MTAKTIDALEFDERFDNGEDMTEFIDFSKARRPGREEESVNLKFPTWMLEALDREAKQLGMTRQSIIKAWLAERIEGLPG